jgi:DNA-binding response OmpR family regulator
MPYMNGLQLYQKLKSISHDVRIMFVSALDAAEELVSLLEINSMDIMRKPLSKEQFVRCVKEHLA